MRRSSCLLLCLALGCAGADLVDEGTPLARPTEAGYHHVGQGTHLLVLGSAGVLTDPRPYQALPTDPELILVTRASGPAWSTKALRALGRQAHLIVPDAALDDAAALGFAAVSGARPGERLRAAGLEVEVFDAGDGRLAYLLTREGRAVFVAGDARTAPETGARLAELCVFPAHANPDDDAGFTAARAVELGARLGCARAILTHRAPGARYPAWFTAPKPGAHVPFPAPQPPSG